MTLRLSSPTSENRRQSAATTLAHDSERPELPDTPTSPISTGLDTGLAEPADDDIVQDYRFVQPDANASRLVSLPAQPISVADQIEQQPGIALRQQSRLDEYRRQLHKARQQMINANTGLVAFIVYQYKTTSLGLSPVGFATSNQANRIEKAEAFPAS